MASRSVTSRAPETLSSSLTRIDRKIHPKTIDVSVHWVSELGYTDTMEKMTLGEIQEYPTSLTRVNSPTRFAYFSSLNCESWLSLW